MRVAICICTFKRQELLRDLLDGISKLSFHKAQQPQIQVVVVDNDEHGSAREICSAFVGPWPLQYVVEQQQGISYARNRAIAEAGGVDFVAFIDDDEIPVPEWLDELLWTQVQFAADVVSGPVFPKYSPGIPDWVKSGGFFQPRVFATGTERKTCACNNVLIRTEVFTNVGRFDDAFALSGAEDTNFFLRVGEAGYKIVCSQRAAVFEIVPASRATLSWMLRREYQTGNGWVFCEGSTDRMPDWVVRFCKSVGHVLIGAAGTIWRLLTIDKIGVVRSLQRISLGSGMLAGLTGHRFLAYQSASAEVKDLRVAGARVQ